MYKIDLHNHTVFCDGRNTPEEMVLTALQKGLDGIGFSAHSFVPFDPESCMTEAGEEAYIKEVLQLREKYRGQIRIFLGIEQDACSKPASPVYDFVIGSRHYLDFADPAGDGIIDRTEAGLITPAGDGVTDRTEACLKTSYYAVDDTVEIFERLAEERFRGDYLALAEAYFEREAEIVRDTGCSIVGHFDLVSRFNGDGRYFNEADPRYEAAWQASAEKIVAAGVPFEINVGAYRKGARKEPYPTRKMIEWIHGRGGTFVVSSDSHSVRTVGAGLREFGAFQDEAFLTRLLAAGRIR